MGQDRAGLRVYEDWQRRVRLEAAVAVRRCELCGGSEGVLRQADSFDGFVCASEIACWRRMQVPSEKKLQRVGEL